MTIDEAIIQFQEDAEYNRADLDFEWAEENEQVAKWLEELKVLREKAKGDKLVKQIRADAIDECINLIKMYCTCEEVSSYSLLVCGLKVLKEQK